MHVTSRNTTARSEGSNSHKSHFFLCGTSRGLRIGCSFSNHFFNQISEVLSGMSSPTDSLHYINLIECRCEHVIRFTYNSFSCVLAPWSEFLIEVHRCEDLKWYRSTLRQRRKHNDICKRTCEFLRLGLEPRNSWHALPAEGCSGMCGR